MSDTREHLERWRTAGVIDEATEARILAFEGSARARPTPTRQAGPGILEALVYLGIVVAAVGAVALAGERWDGLRSWARTATVGVPALLALLAGAALLRTDDAGVRRGGQLAWMAATALSAGTIAVIFQEYGEGAGNRDLLVINALGALLLALVLWSVAPAHPQVLAVGGAFVFVAMAIGAWPDDFDLELAGISLFALALAALAATELERFSPQASARLAFGILVASGPYLAGIDGTVIWAELLVFAVGGALGLLSVWRASFVYMTTAIGVIFVGLVTFIFEHFEEDLGAPIALLISGALLVAAVLILTQIRGALRQRNAAP